MKRRRGRGLIEAAQADTEPADDAVVRHLSATIRLRDDDMGRRSERVSLMTAALADWCGVVFAPDPAIRMAAAMYDVGKIGVPDLILLNPGRLTSEETATVRRHCELGHALFNGSESPILTLAASVALNHHERWDGAGYPNHRRGDDIPMEARLTSIADAFDGLISDLVYRAALPVDTAIHVMTRERGGFFDPRLFDVFLEHLDDVLAIENALPDPPAPRITRIVVVDDERVVEAGLTSIIHGREEMRVVGVAHSMAEAIQVVDDVRPDVVLCGYRLPDGDGAGLTEHVLAHRPETKIVVLTSLGAPDVALRCVSAGCSGIVAKTASAAELTGVVRRVCDGEVAIPSDVLAGVVAGLRHAKPALGSDVTPRERDALDYLAKGLSPQEIAVSMGISINTTRNHIQGVIEKLGAHSRLEAVLIAIHENLVDVT